jgi:hypothetical protein
VPPVSAISVNVRHAAGTDATRAEQLPRVRHDPEIADHPGTIGDPQVRQHPPRSCTSIRTEDSVRDSSGQTGIAEPVRQVMRLMHAAATRHGGCLAVALGAARAGSPQVIHLRPPAAEPDRQPSVPALNPVTGDYPEVAVKQSADCMRRQRFRCFPAYIR